MSAPSSKKLLVSAIDSANVEVGGRTGGAAVPSIQAVIVVGSLPRGMRRMKLWPSSMKEGGVIEVSVSDGVDTRRGMAGEAG